MERDEEPTYLEQYFLDKLETILLTDTEIHELIKLTDDKEIINKLSMAEDPPLLGFDRVQTLLSKISQCLIVKFTPHNFII